MTEFYHDKANRLLVYNLPSTQQITRYIPNHLDLGAGWYAFPFTLFNCQVLKFFKLHVPMFLDDETYDWPIRKGRHPREHQRVMTNFMLMHPRCFNLSDMGTMKTQATLWAADYLMSQHPPGSCRAIVVGPLSILQRTWGDALFNDFLGRRTYAILTGDAKRRQRELAKPVDFYLINFDGVGVGAKIHHVKKRRIVELHGLAEQIAKREDIKICVIDEAAAYRDGRNKRHLIARHVLQHKPYFWPLTGTPTPNSPEDAHGLARLVNNAWGETFDHYKKRVMYQVSQYQWVPRRGASEEAHKLLQPSVRFDMRECTDVPPSFEVPRDVELSAEQAKMYKEFKRDLRLELAKGPITAANQAVLRAKLIQISCGAIYDHDHNVTRIDASPRIAVLREVIEEAGRKVIIFAPLTSVIHLLYEELKDYSRAYVNGEVPVAARNEIFRLFQDTPDPHIIIADPATMSHGLDLFAASVVVWYGATDSTELYVQANRRIDRPGQTVATTIVQLAATPIEREIYRRAAGNISMQGAILELVKENG